MIGTGLQYFASNLGLNNNLQVYYGFTGINGGIISNLQLQYPQYSGGISNTSQFYNISGSGTFNGLNYVSVKNASGLWSNNWSMILTYEKSGNNQDILFSSFQTGAINSGFTLGVNNANNIYISYYDNNGYNVNQSKNILGTKNAIIVTKMNNAITFDYFDMNKKVLESENFSVNDTYFNRSDIWNIGGNGTTGLVGNIDNFAYFTPALLPNQKLPICSGLYSIPVAPSSYILSFNYNEITGYLTGQNLLSTGITGSLNQFLGYISGTCGNLTSQFSITNLTGSYYQSYLTTLTTNISIPYYTGYTGFYLIENSGYVYSFGMDAVTFLKYVSPGSVSELYYFTSQDNKTNINKSLNFDRVQNAFITDNYYDINQLNFYANSLGQFGSGYSITGNFYTSNIILSGMYLYSGLNISGDYSNIDIGLYDIISGARNGRIFTGSQTGFNSFFIPNSDVYLNGFKLVSGSDYVYKGNNIIVTNSGITGSGFIWTFPIDTASTYNKGNWNNLATTRFARGTSQLFLNGLRQIINEDYIEASKYSLLNNVSHYPSVLGSGIYNNSNDFIENL